MAIQSSQKHTETLVILQYNVKFNFILREKYLTLPSLKSLNKPMTESYCKVYHAAQISNNGINVVVVIFCGKKNLTTYVTK